MNAPGNIRKNAYVITESKVSEAVWVRRYPIRDLAITTPIATIRPADNEARVRRPNPKEMENPNTKPARPFPIHKKLNLYWDGRFKKKLNRLDLIATLRLLF